MISYIVKFLSNKYVILGVVLTGLLLIVLIQHKQISTLQNSYSIAVNNEKASFKQSQAYKFTIDQLRYFNDSINSKLDSTRKALKIKDKSIQSMQYIHEDIGKPTADTIHFHDTLFTKNLRLDTIVGDAYYSLRIHMSYPDTLLVKPYFINEKMLFVSSKKETIDPPKKFFILRWFQRKHIILTVDIKDSSPYVSNKEQRYIQILKN